MLCESKALLHSTKLFIEIFIIKFTILDFIVMKTVIRQKQFLFSIKSLFYLRLMKDF